MRLSECGCSARKGRVSAPIDVIPRCGDEDGAGFNRSEECEEINRIGWKENVGRMSHEVISFEGWREGDVGDETGKGDSRMNEEVSSDGGGVVISPGDGRQNERVCCG
jgi:hypothetical protein